VDTLNFLRRICARQGETVITTLDKKSDGNTIFWNRGSYKYSELQEAAEIIPEWDSSPSTTVYFSIGAFANHIEEVDGKQKIRRTQANATYFRVLCFDLDCGEGKPYASLEEGLVELSRVVKHLKLPKPLIVGSGDGAHVYWVLDKDIEKGLWVKASTALSHALAQNNLEIDVSKIFDPSMVLRPVGTYHKKREPWKEVKILVDDGEVHDIYLLYGKVKDYEPKVAPPKPKSKLLDAVLNTPLDSDLDVLSIGEKCNQIKALIESGGQTDAAGNHVDEPMWRASLGIAKFAKDREEAVLYLAGGHPEFDLDDNMRKIDGYKGTGPTTCGTFNQLCPKGCEGCPYLGNKTSPAQLGGADQIVVQEAVQEVAAEEQPPEQRKIKLPDFYKVNGGKLYKEVEKLDDDGNPYKDMELISERLMYIKNIFTDTDEGKSSFTLAVHYPNGRGWEEKDHDMTSIAASGKDFSSFLLHLQVFCARTQAQQEKLRVYLMDYLAMVQQQSNTGYDYKTFGWQKDGSFICGEKVINPPHGDNHRRLVGDAAKMAEFIKQHGSREKFVEAMAMLDKYPGTETIRSSVLLGLSGILAKYLGNGSSMISIYSTESTTGKTASLISANSLFGSPKELLGSRRDTNTATFMSRGTLNNLPMTIDEFTMVDPKEVADVVYSFSEGRDKKSSTQTRQLRTPATWDGPTFVSANSSVIEKVSEAKAQSGPLRVRVLELPQHDRKFVSILDDNGNKVAHIYFDLLLENYGFAGPEIAQAVVDIGGPKLVASKAREDFNRVFEFAFEAQERFYESLIIAAWGLGKIGKALGLLPFDIKATIRHILNVVEASRQRNQESVVDAIDVIGQFMHDKNDKRVEAYKEYGASNKFQVHMPAPLKAVVRQEIVTDKNGNLMPGSVLAISKAEFKRYIRDTNDAEERILRELDSMVALISDNRRITLFKGCQGRNPTQTWCIIVNLTHPRFADIISELDGKETNKLIAAVHNVDQAEEA
jgi:hypothetical protein